MCRVDWSNLLLARRGRVAGVHDASHLPCHFSERRPRRKRLVHNRASVPRSTPAATLPDNSSRGPSRKANQGFTGRSSERSIGQKLKLRHCNLRKGTLPIRARCVRMEAKIPCWAISSVMCTLLSTPSDRKNWVGSLSSLSAASATSMALITDLTSLGITARGVGRLKYVYAP